MSKQYIIHIVLTEEAVHDKGVQMAIGDLCAVAEDKFIECTESVEAIDADPLTEE